MQLTLCIIVFVLFPTDRLVVVEALDFALGDSTLFLLFIKNVLLMLKLAYLLKPL